MPTTPFSTEYPELHAIAGLTSAADKLAYFTGAGTAGLADFTAAGRALVAAADARAMAAILGTPYDIAKSAVAVSHTGDTTETTLATINIPAGAIGPNGQVEVITLWSMTNSANAKTVRTKFGGLTVGSVASTTVGSLQTYYRVANRNSAFSQVAMASGTQFTFGTSSGAVVTGAIDTTASVSITLTAQLANFGETITLESYLVRLTYGA